MFDFDAYDNFAELHAAIEEEFGEDWDRSGRFGNVVPWEKAVELEEKFVEACYRIYPLEYELRSVLNTDELEFRGRPFKLGEPVAVDDPDSDLCALPLWHVIMEDDGDTFVTYPEEVFFVDD